MKNNKIKQNKDNRFSLINYKDININLYNSLKDQKYQLIPFKVILNDVGDIRYTPASVQEWKNSIYTYNSNYMKNLPVYDINVNDLIKKYFSLYFKPSFFKGKYISRYMRKKRRTLLKIYVSKAEVKHTNSKALINIFIVDREKKVLYKTIKNILEVRFWMYIWKSLYFKEKLEYKDFLKWINIYYPRREKFITKKYLGYKLLRKDIRLGWIWRLFRQKREFYYDRIKTYLNKKWKVNYMLRAKKILFSRSTKIDKYSGRLNIINKPRRKGGLNNNNIRRYISPYLYKFRFRNNFRFENYYFDSIDNSEGISIYFRHLIYRFFLNKYKFERILLYRLGIYLKKIYKKKIEFNIINLKSVNFNVDILTSMLTLRIKIRKKKQSPRPGWESLRLQRRTKYPININNIVERMYEDKIKDMSVLENNYRNLNINSLIFSESNRIDLKDSSSNETKEILLYDTKNKDDILNKALLSFYKGKSIKDKNIKNHLINLNDIIFKKIIKYKNMGALWCRILLICPWLSNSGKTLKLLVLKYIWKNIYELNNYLFTVTIQKIQETEIGYHGSKSIILNTIVKEQRVNGRGFYSLAVLNPRCTLTGFERNYQVRILSNQINKNVRRFYLQNSNVLNLDSWFLTGFVDAEGCFLIRIRKNNNLKIGWNVELRFQISLHKKDKILLEQIQNFFGIGNISKHGQ